MSASGKHRRLAIVIHDLNSWMGQERCTLELARRLSHHWPVDLYSFSFDDDGPRSAWGERTHHRAWPSVKHPFLLRTLVFYLVTAPRLIASRRRRGSLIHTAGACSLVGDVVQIHYVHAAWKEKRKSLPKQLSLGPRVRSSGGIGSALMRLYYESLLRFNVATEHLAFTRRKTYVAISHRIAAELREHFGLTDDVHVVHHGVDPDRFQPVDDANRADRETLRRKWGVGDDDVVVLFVGAYERKGLESAIRSLARLDDRSRQRVFLVAIGSGNDERYHRIARDLGLADRVLLPGPQKDIAGHYRAGDLFLFPTLYEPFGMVVLEAMACGLPVVVSREAGASELIEDGVSGFLVEDPSDTQEIASHLARLVSDDRARREVGRAARRIACRRTWDTVAREYGAILEPFFGDRLSR